MAFPVVAGVVLWLTQAGGTWFADTLSGPPGLDVHSAALSSCNRYVDGSPREFELPPQGLGPVGSPVTAEERDPAVLPITLQGKDAHAVVVTGIEVRVLESKKAPASGFLVGDGCGAVLMPRTFAARFSDTSARLEPVPDRKGRKVDFPLQVSDSDPEQIELQLFPGDRDIRFTVRVDWLSEGEPGGVLLDNDGAGYRVVGGGTLPRYGISGDGLVRAAEPGR